jgi:hypothetical protein
MHPLPWEQCDELITFHLFDIAHTEKIDIYFFVFVNLKKEMIATVLTGK